MDTRSKIISLEQAAEVASRLRSEGRRLALAAGCFDVLRASQARFLSRLRGDGAALLVAVYGDQCLRRLLRRAEPILGEQARARMVAALAAVDYVVIWREEDLNPLQRRLQSDPVEVALAEEGNIIAEVLKRRQ